MEPPFLSSQNHRFPSLQSWESTKRTAYFDARYWHRYLSKTSSYSAVRFIFEMILLAWLLKIVITLPISLTVLLISGDPAVWQNPQQAVFAAHPVANAMLALAVAPILETIIGQWAPLAAVRQWTPRRTPALVAATLFFADLNLLPWDVMLFLPRCRWASSWLGVSSCGIVNRCLVPSV